jgi:ABC-type multidrug transport system ATPase subunit/multidrug resistance efflux pump
MLALGAWLVIDAHASPGIMVAATILLGRALQPVEQLIGGWKVLVEARGAWQRLSERPAVQTAQAGLELPAPSGRLELERVIFSPVPLRPPLIKGVAFTLEAGESLGVIGPSASGKTTLIRLILGIWKPQAGVIRLDGADIARWDRDALGQHIGYLPQDVELFAGTVAENIARLGPVNSEQVVDAARLAHAHEMILRLPDGYETQIGEAGAILSGGQRQRIAFARALHGNPRLVVLDEPNANLDAQGEAALTAALGELKARGVTTIMVGHAAVMSQLDKLAVLNEGALEAFGPRRRSCRGSVRSPPAPMNPRLRRPRKTWRHWHEGNPSHVLRSTARARRHRSERARRARPADTTDAGAAGSRGRLDRSLVSDGALVGRRGCERPGQSRAEPQNRSAPGRRYRPRDPGADGQRVRAGQPLVVVGDVRSDSELSLLQDQLRAARIRSARAEAEAALQSHFSAPADLAGQADAAEHLAREHALFTARRRTLDEQIAALEKQIREAHAQAAALEGQIAATETSAKLSAEELEMNNRLVREGFINRTKLLELQRGASDYVAKVGEYRSELAKARERVGELEARMAQARNQYQQQAADELKEASAKVRELGEKLRPSQDQVERQMVRSPVDGEIMSMRVSAVGEVVAPREPILDVVPKHEKLVVEARIHPRTSYSKKSTRRCLGAFDARTVARLAKAVFGSPDCVTDLDTGVPGHRDCRSGRRESEELSADSPARAPAGHSSPPLTHLVSVSHQAAEPVRQPRAARAMSET